MSTGVEIPILSADSVEPNVQPSTSKESNVLYEDPPANDEQPSTSKESSVLTGTQSSIDQAIHEVISKFCAAESERDGEGPTEELIWFPPTGAHLKNFDFDLQRVGITDEISESYITKAPNEFFKIFFNDQLLDLIVLETNRYAQQSRNKPLPANSRLHRWKDTDNHEISTFFGIVLYMGLKKLPRMSDYWSKNPLYCNQISARMSRNRFELLLRMLHFNDNETIVEKDRLGKLSPLLNILLAKFTEIYIPEQSVCIDETLVPFRGRLSFRQYIKNKRFKFGIKLYKLCCKDGYTYYIKVYCGKDKQGDKPATLSTVMSLMTPLLDHGRILFTDNYYTSVALAHALQNRKTHLVGTLRKNRKNNPRDVESQKLKKGEIYAKESNTGVVVLKWHDKRDILCLSTCHTDQTTKYLKRGNEIEKPTLIVDYNASKSFIDLSDQLKSYSSPLRKGIKWYRKLAFEIILGSAVVNSYILYKNVTKDNLSITEFREKVALSLLQIEKINVAEQAINENSKHVLEEVLSKDRRKCVSCYEKISAEQGRKIAQTKGPKTRFVCKQCNKYYCLSCFFDSHNYYK